MAPIAVFERPRLIVVTGKGGVGKSTVSALLAAWLADRGRDTLLMDADAREHLHLLLDLPPSAGTPVPAGHRLHLLATDPRAELDRLIHARVKVGAIARRVTGSPIYRHFVDGAPGLREMSVLGYAVRALDGELDAQPDAIVLDAPATGHGLSLLTAPLLVAESLGSGPLGTLAARVARCVADPGATAVVVVTHADELPMTETLETITAMRQRFGRPPALVVVNAVYPPLPPRAPRAPAGARDAAALWHRRRQIAERELARLHAQWSGAVATLPLVGEGFGPSLVTALAGALDAALRAEAA